MSVTQYNYDSNFTLVFSRSMTHTLYNYLNMSYTLYECHNLTTCLQISLTSHGCMTHTLVFKYDL